MRMAGELLLASQFAAAALMLALAGLLLYLNFTSRLNRAFALFLTLRAMVILTNRIPELAPGDVDYFARVGAYFLVGAGGALAYFALLYPRPAAGSLALLLATGIPTILVIGLYARDHCVLACDADLSVPGPLYFTELLLPIVSAIAAWRLARAARRDPLGSVGLRIVALGFAANAAIDVGLSAAIVGVGADVGAGYDGPWRWTPHLTQLAATPFLLLYLASDRRILPWALSTLSFVVGALVGSGLTGPFALFILGFGRLVLPIAAGYALVRHSMFDLTARARVTLGRATIGGMFVATFFVVSEVAEGFLTQRLGTILGILAAGLLAFALDPLQRLAHRVAATAIPGPLISPDLPIDQRHAIYRESALLAWEDGAVDQSERIMLEKLRAALSLDLEEARLIESEAARR